MKKGKKRRIILGIWLIFIIAFLIIGIYQSQKPLPPNISFAGSEHQTNDIQFLHDLTYEQKNGETTSEQEIFDEVTQLITEAEEFILVDMFLFNAYSSQERDFPDLSGRLTDALIQQKAAHPGMTIVFITDPINTGYHSYAEPHLQKLKEHDIEVVLTNLHDLRDSNKAYSAVWRLLIQPFGQEGNGWLPNPFASDAPDMTVRSYLELLNVKANHRKVVLSEKNAIIASANPHNESGFASNIAFKVSGDILTDIQKAEQAVIDYSGGQTQLPKFEPPQSEKSDTFVQYLTEGKILNALVEEINQTDPGDTLWSGMFYLANRSTVEAMENAAQRGVTVNLILDPNKTAFGNRKTGLPNMPIASELHDFENVNIRWYQAGENQYHTKLLFLEKTEENVIIGGSANFTTRNLDDLNLESDLKITTTATEPIAQDVQAYFNRLWHNTDGEFTESYATNEGALTPMLRFTYWLQKLTGLTSY